MRSTLDLNNEKPRAPRKAKSICLAFPSEAYYERCVEDFEECRRFLNRTYATNPEVFPKAFAKGFRFHGFFTSQKLGVTIRRIRLQGGDVFQIHPSFVMPYMVGRTQEMEKPLYLRRFGVPFEALAYVFGKDAMYWYRAYISLGRNHLVGTTLKDPAHLPDHLIADEKHTRRKGHTVYVPTTVAKGCILGASLTDQADMLALSKGYGEFRKEAMELKGDYAPKSVNTDGWEATKNAWKALFPKITLILCFLHAFLKIKIRCSRKSDLFEPLQDKVWNIYFAKTLSSFAQRIRRFREWAEAHIPKGVVKDKVLDLCQNAPNFKIPYRLKGAYRTSNGLERLMNYQDRLLYAGQYLHGSKENGRLYLRAMALLWNFHPYGKRAQYTLGEGASPFLQIHGFVYHQNWLHNLRVAASLKGQKL